ncbi:hypothetical protein [Lacunimicrobium album]|jgi:hypothetical protein
MPSKYLSLLLIWPCLACVGCGPTAQPTWAPDSKSFFYAHADGSVLQYDLEKKAARTLIAAGDQQLARLDVNTAGTFLGVAHAAYGSEARAAQFGTVALLTGRVRWNDLSVWGGSTSARSVCPTSVYYCPTGKRVLIWYQQPYDIFSGTKGEIPMGYFAVYDFETRKLEELQTATPAITLAQMANVSPMVPDGSGYLAMKLTFEKPLFFFVTWDGWEYPIELDERSRELLNSMGSQDSDKGELMHNLFPLPQGVWDKNVLTYVIPHGQVRIDPVAKTFTTTKLTKEQQANFERIHGHNEGTEESVSLEVVRFPGVEREVHCRAYGQTGIKVLLVNLKTKGRRTIAEGALPAPLRAHQLFLSPDGERVLAWVCDEEQTASIHVIESDGSISATVDAGRRE